MNDIYFLKEYGSLYENIDNGVCEYLKFKDALGSISYVFIKREIPLSIDGINFFDIISPYGYGGPLILNYKEGQKDELIKKYNIFFESYCKKNNIISEFVRFHPLFNNALDFKYMYDIFFDRKTVGTNLLYDNVIESEFSKSCRKNIKKALASGIGYEVIVSPDNLSEFKEIYYSTMQRNEANDYYFFTDEYFNNCIKYFRNNILLIKANYDNKTIAMGLYFIYNKIIHIHLSGTLSDYLNLSPAYILRYAVTLWGKENGYELIHHGGGRTNSKEDSLYLFKKQFGKNTEFDFKIGKKIYNNDIYMKLCNMKNADANSDFFPAYRLKR